MPYTLTDEGDYYLMRWYGVLTPADLMSLCVEMEAVEVRLPVTPNRVTDLTAVERFDLDFARMLNFAKQRKTRVFPNDFRSAIIVDRDVGLGFSRMFQILNDNPQIEIRIVPSIQEALAWFREKGDSSSEPTGPDGVTQASHPG